MPVHANSKPRRRMALMVVILVAAGCAATPKPKPQADPDLLALEEERAEFRTKKRELVEQAMQLEPRYQDAFWREYAKYEADMKGYYDQRYQILKDYADNLDHLTDRTAEDLAERSLDNLERRLSLYRKHFDAMRKATSALVAARFLQLENRLNLLADLKITSEAPAVPVDGEQQ